MTVLRKAALAALLLAAAAPVAPASANCFGSATSARLCLYPENVVVDPDGGPAVSECVTVVAPPCIPVNAGTPSAGTSGPLHSFECYACTNLPNAGEVVDALDPYLERVNQIADQVTRMECAPAQRPSSSGVIDRYQAAPVLQNLRDFVDSCVN